MRVCLLTCVVVLSQVGVALAGIPAPLPIAGATGPIGLVIAVGGYIAYRIFRTKK